MNLGGKVKVTFLTVVALFAVFAAGYADSRENTRSVQFSAGITAPVNPDEFTTFWNPGFNFGFAVSFPLEGNLSLRTGIDFSRLFLDEEQFSPGIVDGGDISALTIAIAGQLKLPLGEFFITPYLLGGLGFLDLTSQNAVVTEGDQETFITNISTRSIVAFGGAGLDIFSASYLTIFVEASLVHSLDSEAETQFIPYKLGIAIPFN